MIGWFDGGAGASGDMLLGALHGAGVPLDVFTRQIERLDLGIELRAEPVRRAGLAATRVHVGIPPSRSVRHLDDVLALLTPIDEPVADLVSSIFRRLARAESTVHGTGVDDVHFHEVGALDSIADIVGAAAGFVHLGLDRVACSPLALGSGTVRCEHGLMPVPVPAVLELVADGTPVTAGPAPFESTTPTGAAVLVTVVDEWGPLPPMTVDRVGMGAGGRDVDDHPNALRLVVGEALPSPTVDG
ncbi:MAG: LarC family nickel insertion protein [Actinomycetota bacterium]